MNQAVTIYAQAKQALAEYKTVDEVKDYRDKAVAIEAYAKQANDMDLEWDAARARVRAERKCGELLRDTEKAKGGEQYHQSQSTTSAEPVKTLSEMGISKDQSSNWQKLAAVPEEEFEKAVDHPGAKPSTNHIIKPKEPPPPRMDADALWLWGTLRDMRGKHLFSKTMVEVTSEWTDAMHRDADSIIPQLKEWIINHEH